MRAIMMRSNTHKNGVMLLLACLWLISADCEVQGRRQDQYRQYHHPIHHQSIATTTHSIDARKTETLHQPIPRGGARLSPKKSSTKAVTPKATPTKVSDNGSTGATIPSHVFNLIKSIVGAGVLGLPAGIAAFGDAPSAVLPALGLLIAIGTMSAYGFSLIGRLCYYTKSYSYRQVWEKTVSPTSAWIPAAACLLVTSCSVVTYSMILSNTIPALASFLNPNWSLSATQGLLGITSVALLPLCLLKNLKSLAPFSLLGIIGMVYTSLAMVVRYLQGSYQLPPPVVPEDMITTTATALSAFLKTLDAKSIPKFGNKGAAAIFTPNAFVLVSMLATAYMAHYNAPKFYWELKDASVARFGKVVVASFGGSVVLMLTVAVAGFLTFGGACQGLILNNYSTSDVVMTASRFAVTLSLLFSYPLAFVGARDGVLDLLKVPQEKRSEGVLNILTIILLAGVTTLALMVSDLRFVMAFGGATWGNAVIYLLPSFMMYKYCAKLRASSSGKTKKTQQEQDDYKSLKKELPLAVLNGLLGLIMGCIGSVRAIQSM